MFSEQYEQIMEYLVLSEIARDRIEAVLGSIESQPQTIQKPLE